MSAEHATEHAEATCGESDCRSGCEALCNGAYVSCDLCAENGMETPAVADMRTPSGMWANVCAAHRVRLGGK